MERANRRAQAGGEAKMRPLNNVQEGGANRQGREEHPTRGGRARQGLPIWAAFICRRILRASNMRLDVLSPSRSLAKSLNFAEKAAFWHRTWCCGQGQRWELARSVRASERVRGEKERRMKREGEGGRRKEAAR